MEFGAGCPISTFDFSNVVYVGGVIYKAGIAYAIPLTGNFFATTSLTFCGSGYLDSDDKFKLIPGASFAPRLICKLSFLTFTAGLDFMYMKGADRIGTSFAVGVGFDL